MSISGWSLLPIYRLKPNSFPPARCVYRGQATAHLATTRTPAPAPTLAWRPCTPLPASPPARLSRVVFHRIVRDRWRRPALRHPAHSSLDLRERGLMLKVSRACFYRFTQGLHGRALLPDHFSFLRYRIKRKHSSILSNPHPMVALPSRGAIKVSFSLA